MKATNNQIPYRQLFLQYSKTAVNVLVPVFLFPYTTRVLGPNSYGVMGYYESLQYLVVVLAAFGIPYYGLRKLSKKAIGDATEANTVLHLVVINLLMAFLGTLVFLCYVWLKPAPIGTLNIQLLYAANMLFFMLHLEWYFQSQERYAFLFRRTLYIRLASLLAVVWLVREPGDLEYYLLIGVGTTAATALSSWYQLRGLFSNWQWNPKLFTELLAAAWPFALIGILGAFYLSIDTIVLANYASTDALGHYTVATKIVRLSINFFIASSVVIFVRLFRTSFQQQLHTDSLLLTTHISIPIGAVLLVFAEPVVLFVSGAQYGPAVQLLQIIALLWLMVPLRDFICLQVLLFHHKEKQLLRLLLYTCAVAFISMLMLIPAFQAAGAAWATFITEACFLAGAVWLTRNYFQISSANWLEIIGSLAIFPIAWIMNKLTAAQQWPALLQLTIGASATLFLHALLQLHVFKSRLWLQVRQKLWGVKL